ncbi:uncharacterized protein M6B38_137130 [Iris pallida]|uniref:Uncharacterized protein n=1 Tax=Iris pallida TaxID=29817 RepID=A0AAX6FDS5_IRIPA|nr:uncharacterized protein M6B38_137130 [Iris pallida]
MALPVPTDSNRPNWNPSDCDDWEICNDNGFVYKRRRRIRHLQPSSSSADNADATSLRRYRRARKRKYLLSLKDKYTQELNHWKSLSFDSAVAADVGPTSTSASSVAPPLLPTEAQPEQQPVIDELLLQAEAQEAVLRKLSELCDYVDSVCVAEEEIFAKELADLPIWDSPKALLACLQSL